MRPRLVLIRHGQAAFDQDDYDRLSPLGERQAAAFGRWWRRHDAMPVTRCWTGPMRRQQATAALATAAANAAAYAAAGPPWPDAEPVAALAEFDHREIFYAHRPELRDPQALAAWKAAAPDYPSAFEATWQAALQRWMSGRFDAGYAETWPGFQARCRKAATDLLDQLGHDGLGLAFTSSGPIAVLLDACRAAGAGGFVRLQASLGNGSYTELFGDPTRVFPARLGQVNVTPHLNQEAERSLR